MRHTFTFFLALNSAIFALDSNTIPLMQRKKPQAEQTAKAKKPKEGQKPVLASVDTFGSPRLTTAAMKETLGKDLEAWLSIGMTGDPAALSMEKRLVQKIQEKFGFAFAEWSIIQYFEPTRIAVRVTLDVVEPKDAGRRMPFWPKPTGKFTDKAFAPAMKLISQWREYESKALALVETGKLDPDSQACIAFHCPFAHEHKDLKSYEPLFVEGVNAQGDKFLQIQKQDTDPGNRAAATFLLAYLSDGKSVVAAMVDRIRDPDPLVRNNALRVLGEIAEYHKDLDIPARPVLEALDFPRVSDRSKAVKVTQRMALNSGQVRDEILASSVPSLLAMLASEQPDNREVAHSVLRKISGKEFTAQQIQSWANWYSKVTKDRDVAKK